MKSNMDQSFENGEHTGQLHEAPELPCILFFITKYAQGILSLLKCRLLLSYFLLFLSSPSPLSPPVYYR